MASGNQQTDDIKSNLTEVTTPPVIEKVTADETMARFEGPDGRLEMRELTPLQSAGLRLAYGAGIVGSVVIVIILIGWLVLTIQSPAQAPAVVDNCIKLMESILGKLMPAFTLIVGYVLGKSDGGGSGNKLA